MSVICEHVIAYAIVYFAKIRISHIFPQLRFQNCICGNYAAYAKIRIFAHISAYAITFFSIAYLRICPTSQTVKYFFCIVLILCHDDGRQLFTYFAKIHILHIFPHIIAFSTSHYAEIMPHILHICCIFRQISHIFPHILHQNSPHILRKISAINRHPYLHVA